MNKKLNFSLNYRFDNNHVVSAVNAQRTTLPSGYHYMPDGSVMSDVKHMELYGTAAPSHNFISILTGDIFTTIAVVTFTAKSGYYYSSIPTASISANDRNNYSIEESINTITGNTISKSFTIKYKATKNNNVGSINFSFKLDKLNLKPDIISKIDKFIETKEDTVKKEIEENIKQDEVKEEKEKALSVSEVKIKNIAFDKEIISGYGETRSFVISGGATAKYHLIITRNSDSNTYDPDSNSFTSDSTRFVNTPIGKSLNITIPSQANTYEKYSFEITPVDSVYDGDVSDLKFDVEQSQQVTGTISFRSGGVGAHIQEIQDSSAIHVLSKKESSVHIDQTFTSTTTNNSFMRRLPVDEETKRRTLDDIFVIRRSILTDDVADEYANTNTIKLDTVDGLAVGDKVSGSSPFSSSSTQYITGIDKDKKTITVTSSQNLNDNQSLTFESNASALERISGGSSLVIEDIIIQLEEEKTTTDNVSSNSKTINVASTQGTRAAVSQTVDATGGGYDGGEPQIKHTLDAITGLSEGMRLIKANAATLVNLDTDEGVYITNIDTTTKTITLNKQQIIEDGDQIYFGRTRVSGPGITGYPYVYQVSSNNTVEVEPDNQTLENGIAITYSGTSRTANITLLIDKITWGKYSWTASIDVDNLINLGT